jgi:hypothetical protein
MPLLLGANKSTTLLIFTARGIGCDGGYSYSSECTPVATWEPPSTKRSLYAKKYLRRNNHA